MNHPAELQPFQGSFLSSIIAFVTVHSATSYLNILLLAFLPTIALYYANQHSISLFVVSLVSIAAFDDRIHFLIQQAKFYVSPTVYNLFNNVLSSMSPIFIVLFAVYRQYNGLASMYLTGYFFTSLLLTLGSAFFVAGWRYDVLRFQAKGVHYQVLLLCVGLTAFSMPAVQSLSDELVSNSAATAWAEAQSSLLIILFVCYLVFQNTTHRNLFVKESEVTSFDTASSTLDYSTLKDVRLLFTPVEDNSISSPPNSHSQRNPTSQRMESVGIFLLLVFSLTALCISCAAAIASIENTTKITSIPTSFLVTIVLPWATSLLSVASWTGAVWQDAHLIQSVVQQALQQAINVLFFLYPLLPWCSEATWLFRDLTALELTGIGMTVAAAAFVLPGGHGNWMTGATFVCIYLALAAIFYAHTDADL